MSIGDNIHSIRDQSGLTAEQFSSKIGCSKASLYLYESNEREPSISVVLNICRSFNKSADWLLCLSDSNNTNIDLSHAPDQVIDGIKLILSGLSESQRE